MKMMIVLAVWSIPLCAGAVGPPNLEDPKYDQASTVDIDGRLFLVERFENEVRITDKSLIKRATLAERDAMRAAVQRATRCNITDELYPMDGRLRGRLDCSK